MRNGRHPPGKLEASRSGQHNAQPASAASPVLHMERSQSHVADAQLAAVKAMWVRPTGKIQVDVMLTIHTNPSHAPVSVVLIRSNNQQQIMAVGIGHAQDLIVHDNLGGKDVGTQQLLPRTLVQIVPNKEPAIMLEFDCVEIARDFATQLRKTMMLPTPHYEPDHGGSTSAATKKKNSAATAIVFPAYHAATITIGDGNALGPIIRTCEAKLVHPQPAPGHCHVRVVLRRGALHVCREANPGCDIADIDEEKPILQFKGQGVQSHGDSHDAIETPARDLDDHANDVQRSQWWRCNRRSVPKYNIVVKWGVDLACRDLSPGAVEVQCKRTQISIVLDFAAAASARVWAKAIDAASTAPRTDATPLPRLPRLERLGKILTGKDATPSVWCHVLAILCAVTAIIGVPAFAYGFAAFAGTGKPNALDWAAGACNCVFIASLIFVLYDLPRVVGPNGALWRLSHGARLSVDDAAELGKVHADFRRDGLKYHWFIWAPAWLSFGFFLAFTNYGVQRMGSNTGRAFLITYCFFIGVMHIVAFPFIYYSWVLSLKIASMIATSIALNTARAVQETPFQLPGGQQPSREKNATNDTNPSTTLWYNVAEPAFAMNDGILKTIVTHWQGGLLALPLSAGALSLEFFFLGVNAPFINGLASQFGNDVALAFRFFALIFSAFVLLRMLPNSLGEVASVSDACEMLMKALNDQHSAHLHADTAGTAPLQELEAHLKRINAGKGPGIIVHGVKVDSAFLAQTLTRLAAMCSTAIPLVLALQPIKVYQGVQARVCGLDGDLVGFMLSCVESCKRSFPQEVATSTVDITAPISMALNGSCVVVPAYCIACLGPTMQTGVLVNQLQ